MVGARFLDADFMRINLVCASPTVHIIPVARTPQCIVIACRTEAAGAGVRHGRRREPRGAHALCPGVGGTFRIQIFILTPSPEIWSETVSGGEEVLAGKWGSLFLGYLLGKNIGGGVLVISFRLTWGGCSSHLPFGGVLYFRSEAREVLGSETARVHLAARRRGGRMATRGARAGAGNAGNRIPQRRIS